MNSIFRKDKAIAALTYLLDMSHGVKDKYWLNKVMYYLERESILRFGEPMFYDDLYSMQYGPVSGNVKAGIDCADKTNPNQTDWKNFIRLDNNLNSVYEVNPGDYSLLSDSEIDLIREAYEKFKDFTFYQIMSYFHTNFPEFEEITGLPKRKPITWKDILTRNGYSEEDADEIVSEIQYSALNYSEAYG